MPRPPFAARLAAIQPFRVMDILARAKALEAAGQHIIHMEVGEPDFPTPQPIIDAGQHALAAGHTHYTPATGLPALREAIAQFYADEHGVSVQSDQIIITPGASGALQLALFATIAAGEHVLLPDPGYPCNRNLVELLGGVPVALPVDATSNFQPTAAQIAAAWTEKTRAVMLATPANPTGSVLNPAALNAIVKVVTERGGWVIVDEIYHGLLDDHVVCRTALAQPQHNLIVINSFSKYFGMTGWRLGWLVAPPGTTPQFDKLAQNLFLAAPTLAQHAALAAFTSAARSIMEQRRQLFLQRRDMLLQSLDELGMPAHKPQGAFYVYADVSAITDDSLVFCEAALAAGVAITPGVDFGQHHAAHHVRFAYTTSTENIAMGMARLKNIL